MDRHHVVFRGDRVAKEFRLIELFGQTPEERSFIPLTESGKSKNVVETGEGSKTTEGIAPFPFYNLTR